MRLLSLREVDELDDKVDKRDYGTWLHAVLYKFHATRGEPDAAAAEEARLLGLAEHERQGHGLDEAAFLPFGATFRRFVPRYIQWLHERDAQGARWLAGELELSASPVQWGGVQMQGIIDRIDTAPGEGGAVAQLIDYKTGSTQSLRDRVSEPQEDTQLAFYAALVSRQPQADEKTPAAPLSALYLPLDDAGGIKPVEHVGVESTAELLVDGIGRDLARLRVGARLPALGEGSVCETCEARGVCRRDDWSLQEHGT